jgi:hypothetical protein
VIYTGDLIDGLKTVLDLATSALAERQTIATGVLALAPVVLLWTPATTTRRRLSLIVASICGLIATSLALGLLVGSGSVRSVAFGLAAIGLSGWSICLVVLASRIPGIASSVQLSATSISRYSSHFATDPNDVACVLDIRAQAFDSEGVVAAEHIRAMTRTNPLAMRLICGVDERPIGYWNVVAVGRDSYFTFRRGELSETELIMRAQSLKGCRGKRVYLYVGAVAAVPQTAANSVAALLDLGAFLVRLGVEVQICGISSWAFSDEGLSVANHFHFKRARTLLLGRPIYHASTESEVRTALHAFDVLLRRFPHRVPVVTPESERLFFAHL